ncbi:hypothetical protein HBI26_186350 [Parastagonospora nodorum]|nr:hypothetical protein HBH49_064270 [Parastagonospora nodorum]KAH4188129.1 hypothetical protein HBI95_231980 [Parastagonospora nodorum]KAH5561910.1 hypothetical protein HBI26_186350 [Parastagonospora nodorum]
MLGLPILLTLLGTARAVYEESTEEHSDAIPGPQKRLSNQSVPHPLPLNPQNFLLKRLDLRRLVCILLEISPIMNGIRQIVDASPIAIVLLLAGGDRHAHPLYALMGGASQHDACQALHET